MINHKIARRYAKALFNLAVEKDVLDCVGADIELLKNTWDGHKEFKALLHNPIVNIEKKQHVFAAIFEKHIHPITLQFIHLVISKKRDAEIHNIATEFHNQYKKTKGITTVTLLTATTPDEATRNQVKELVAKYTGHQIELIEKLDEDLIGGLVLSFDNKQYDLSIRSRFRKIAKQLNVKLSSN